MNFTTVVAACLLVASAANVRCEELFPDVPKDHWASQAVLELRQKGIIIGYPNGTFNGVVPPGIPSPKPAYDLSTPRSTWNSFMRAMSGGDETAMRRILSDRCFAVELPLYVGIDLNTASLPERLSAYRALYTRLTVRKFHLAPSFISKDGTEVLADLDDGHLPTFIGFGWEVQLNRIGSTWRITAIFHSEEL